MALSLTGAVYSLSVIKRTKPYQSIIMLRIHISVVRAVAAILTYVDSFFTDISGFRFAAS